MKRYYQEHKDKWNEYRVANKDAINKSKRELYKSNSAVREYYIHMAKAYRKRNPDRRRYVEIRNRYRLSRDSYTKMLAEQVNACAICKLPFTKTPHVDHCHDTHKVRGLLCFNCNRMLGHAQNSTRILNSAASYLEAANVA